MFSGSLCHLTVKRPNLEVATRRLLHQQVKILGQFQCHVGAWKWVTTAIYVGVDISKVPCCHLLQQMSCQSGSQKLLEVLVSHECTGYLSILNLF